MSRRTLYRLISAAGEIETCVQQPERSQARANTTHAGQDYLVHAHGAAAAVFAEGTASPVIANGAARPLRTGLLALLAAGLDLVVRAYLRATTLAAEILAPLVLAHVARAVPHLLWLGLTPCCWCRSICGGRRREHALFS